MCNEKAEYELKHFGFTVEQLKLEVKIMVKKEITKLTEEYAESLVEKSNISYENACEIRSKTAVVANNIFHSLSETLHDLDALIEKNFSIPDNILLEDDFQHEKEYTLEDEAYYKEKVEEATNTFKQNSVFLLALGNEIEMYNTLLPIIKKENEIAEAIATYQKNTQNIESKEKNALVKEIVKSVDSVKK